MFDCKLNWPEHVAYAIKKSNKTLYALRMKKKFKLIKLKILLNSYYYPVLYYNAEIWLMPFLHTGPRQQLLLVSANAIRYCLNYPNPCISFQTLHSKFKESTPDQISLYKISLLLFKIFNGTSFDSNWVDLNLQIISTSRESKFDIHRSANFKIGNNILPIN
jgi:hypothetical protein